eukprot:TRINITY_DN771_c0_g3_i1.p1 TRINITY_DN771_c0_g3~~TRINITY_DN771_c0_g3_i1.p1  ORF type:complete len:415 (+),score=72.38 TRINITY_DN771_c0_g3_i1:3-1247(+)
MSVIVPMVLSIAAGMVLGWSWRPQWASWVFLPPGLGARRFWFGNWLARAATLIAAAPAMRSGWKKLKLWFRDSKEAPFASTTDENTEGPRDDDKPVLTDSDLVDFCQRLDGTDGGTAWQVLFTKQTEGMKYTAWRRDPEDGGPTEYKSQTLLENCDASLMRDFFWDDEFRSQWDELLVQSRTLLECPRTGSQVIHWVRKFPVFLKDREYVIGRRIWSDNTTYYCITRGIPGGHPEVPRKSAPRRVDTFYSSWRIQPAQSRSGEGMASCEVVLFHLEDMGIQRDLAKLGIRQCMWSYVKKIEPGYRAYAELREQGTPLSRMASMANINTPVPGTSLSDVRGGLRPCASVAELSDEDKEQVQPQGMKNGYRMAAVGAVMLVACMAFDHGLVGRFLVAGLAKKAVGRLRRRGRRDAP